MSLDLPDERSLRDLAHVRERTALHGGPWRIVGTIAGAFLGAVLLFAAYAKVLDPYTFAESIHAERLDFFLSAHGVAVLAIALEVGIGLLLLFGVRRTPVMLAATGLVAFLLFLATRTYVAYLRGTVDEAHTCGCFGALVERTPTEAFWQDILLLVPSLVLAWVGRPPQWTRVPWVRVTVAGVLTALALVFTGFAPSLPLDDFATRLRPGLNVSEVCAGKDDKKACVLDVIPLLAEGRHFVVIPDLKDPGFIARVPEFNAHAVAGTTPLLWMLTAEPQDKVQEFQLRRGATFPLQSAPAILLRPLYRRLPRAFLVEDGRILRTWAEIPTLAGLATPEGR